MELGVSSHIRQECACYMSQHWRIYLVVSMAGLGSSAMGCQAL